VDASYVLWWNWCLTLEGISNPVYCITCYRNQRLYWKEY